ncbi:MAG: hypothetical protein JSV54_03380 [Chloroflexota bacterium]|nr:MAG: hypothetical protein JSV54_03380 [Chloroflexota bacterium]
MVMLALGGMPLLMATGCIAPDAQSQTPEASSEKDSQIIAETFLRNSSTFRFDGIEGTLKLVTSEGDDKLYRWQFNYEFQCRHPGYGDRTGMILAQVITSHEAQITIDQGQVIRAVLDSKCDMLTEKIIELT